MITPIADIVAEHQNPTSVIDLDVVGARYLARAKIKSALKRWAMACPPSMVRTNWQHPGLMPYAQSTAVISGWQYQHRGLLASGPTGRGKTRAMWSLMRRLAHEGRDIRYYSASDWFTKLQSQVNYGRDEASGWINAVARAPIVYIDDLGQEAVSTAKQEWCAGWFFQFLDVRLGNRLPLFITTNLTAQGIAGTTTEVRGNPMIRRLLDLCEVVKF